MKKFFEKNKKNILIFTIIFILFVFLYYCFPLTGDDWGKACGKLFDALREGYNMWKVYNGRFFGNSLVVLLKTYPVFKYIFCSLVLTTTIWLCSKYEENKTINSPLLTLFLVLAMPISMFRESISWMSGFANFAIPPICVLSIILISKKCFYEKNVKISKSYYIIAVLSGIFMNLFAEHTSIFSVLLGILLILGTYLSKKKVYKFQIVYLITALIFCIITFLCPAYSTGLYRLNGASDFTSLGFIGKAIYNLKNSTWIMNSFYDNFILNIIVGIIILFNYKNYKSKIVKVLSLSLSFLLIIISPLVVALGYMKYNISLKLLLLGLIVYVVLMLVFIFINYYKKNKSLFYELIVLFLAQFASIAPLLEAFGIGSRCFYVAYIINIIFMFVLLKDLMPKPIKLLRIMIYVCSISVSLVMIYIVYNYRVITDMRESMIKEALDNKSIYLYLPRYKYRFLIHQSGEPQGREYHMRAYKQHYKIPKYVVLSFVDLKDIKKSYEEEFVNISTYVQIPTYDGSNEATHPCIATLKEKISGYKYWMAYTPWPNNQNKYENPSIVVSNDKVSWVVPEGLTNPISGTPKNSNDYYSDPFIFYNEDSKQFELWYRFNPYKYKGEDSLTSNNLLLRRTSSDGINWSDQEIILDDEENETYVSTSVVYENGIYNIWYSTYDHEAVYRYSSDLKTWSNPEKIRHEEIRKTEYGYELLFLDYMSDKIYFTISNDKINYGTPIEIDSSYLERKYFGKKRDRVYKFSIIDEDNTLYVYIPHHVYRNSRSKWSMYLKTFDKKEIFNRYYELQK